MRKKVVHVTETHKTKSKSSGLLSSSRCYETPNNHTQTHFAPTFKNNISDRLPWLRALRECGSLRMNQSWNQEPHRADWSVNPSQLWLNSIIRKTACSTKRTHKECSKEREAYAASALHVWVPIPPDTLYLNHMPHMWKNRWCYIQPQPAGLLRRRLSRQYHKAEMHV